MKIYVFRHGAADFSDKKAARSDLGPSITDEGRNHVRNVSRAARGLEVSPSVIFTSPLARAVQTAEAAREFEWPSAEIKVTDALMPESSPEDVYKALSALKSAESAMLVTHYPLLGHLISDMLGCEPSIEVQNGAIVYIESKGKPKRSAGTLKWLLPQMPRSN